MIADFERLLSTDLADIAALASSFAEWGTQAALTQREIFQVNVVLEELVTNVIVHGLGVAGPGWVRLRIARQEDYLALELRDNAPPFDPFEATPPPLGADIDARMIGGLGIHLVRKLADEYSYARAGGQNIVQLRKRLDARLSGCGSSR